MILKRRCEGPDHTLIKRFAIGLLARRGIDHRRFWAQAQDVFHAHKTRDSSNSTGQRVKGVTDVRVVVGVLHTNTAERASEGDHILTQKVDCLVVSCQNRGILHPPHPIRAHIVFFILTKKVMSHWGRGRVNAGWRFDVSSV